MDLIQKACNLGFILKNKEYYLWELQKWLRETHWIHINITKESIGSDEKVYAYEIEYLPKEFWWAKRHVKHLLYIESFYEGMGSYGGGWDTYEEALEKGLQEALKLIQTNKTGKPKTD